MGKENTASFGGVLKGDITTSAASWNGDIGKRRQKGKWEKKTWGQEKERNLRGGPANVSRGAFSRGKKKNLGVHTHRGGGWLQKKKKNQRARGGGRSVKSMGESETGSNPWTDRGEQEDLKQEKKKKPISVKRANLSTLKKSRKIAVAVTLGKRQDGAQRGGKRCREKKEQYTLKKKHENGRVLTKKKRFPSVP